MPPITRSRKSTKSFPFRDLPNEIQLKIFHIFKPAIVPAPCSGVESSDETVADKSTALNITTLDRSTFKDFAPHFYQHNLIEFTEPVFFASDFLLNATKTCLRNLKYLRCTLHNDSFLDESYPTAKVKRLARVINTWTELSNLKRFELVIDPNFLCNCGPSVLSADLLKPDSNAWNMVDTATGGKLSEMERLLTSGTLRGFEVGRKLCHDPTVTGLIPTSFRGITGMVTTFVKGG